MKLDADQQGEVAPLLTSGKKKKQGSFYIAICGYACLLFSVFLCSMPVSYLAVDLRERKDVSETATSVMISAYTYAYGLSCVVSPKLSDRFDSHNIMVVSYSILLLVQVLFAYLLLLPAKTVAIVGVLLRATGGFCAAIFETIFTSWIIRTYKNHVGTVVSVTEAVIGCGFLVGPIAGGFLFQWTMSLCKTHLLCLVPGVFVHILFTVTLGKHRSHFFECSNDDKRNDNTTLKETVNKDSHSSFINILRSWQMVYIFSQTFWVTLFDVLPTGILASYLESIYTTYSSSSLAGVILFVKGIGFTIGSITTGYMTDKQQFVKTIAVFYVISPLLMGVGLVIVGLETFVPNMPPSLVRLIAPSILVSFSSGIGTGPMLKFILSVWKDLNPDENVDYTTYLTSIFLVTFSLGEAVGVNIGGVLYNVIPFENILGIWGCVSFVYFLTNLAFIICLRDKPYMKSALGCVGADTPL